MEHYFLFNQIDDQVNNNLKNYDNSTIPVNNAKSYETDLT